MVLLSKITNNNKQYNYILLAENFYLNNDKEKAISFYGKALEFTEEIGEYTSILYNIAEIYDELDYMEKSLFTYEKITKINPGEAGAYYGMAMLYEKMNDFDKALEYYHKAIDMDPNYDRAYYYAANIFDEKGNKDKAIEYYNKVIELAPDDYISYNNIGSIYEELGQYNKALKFIEKSLELEPEYYKALFNKGVVLKALGDNKKALEYYYRVIDIYPEYPYSFLNISAIYIEEKRYEDTIDLLTDGINHNPDGHDLYYNRACCYSLLNDDRRAISDLRKAIVLLPSIIEYIRTDKDFVNLHDNKDFIKLINR
ncbi:tetratricopeptide repeat protein [Tissierella sp. MB52-C2]|nr:tetratricopeptide repeat protein [Tissierella sp. MB52-C2]WMM25727.1 tetratricopeptide repeat protein [Tissierella sp. MB52-C2]